MSLDESEKVSLKLNIQKTKIMVSSPITSMQIDGETVETVADFILGGSKITADGDCSHEIKRCFLLGRKVMTSLDSILKSRDITLSAKVHLVKAMVFPVVVYRCESWTIKKAEHRRTDAFELWCWKRLSKLSTGEQIPTNYHLSIQYLSDRELRIREVLKADRQRSQSKQAKKIFIRRTRIKILVYLLSETIKVRKKRLS